MEASSKLQALYSIYRRRKSKISINLRYYISRDSWV